MPLCAVNAPIALTARAAHAPGSPRFSLSFLYSSVPDIVDIKPANMEELTEVITAAEFHPHHCNTFVYSSSKGTIRLCDMRASALCDRHTKCEYPAQGPWGRGALASDMWEEGEAWKGSISFNTGTKEITSVRLTGESVPHIYCS